MKKVILTSFIILLSSNPAFAAITSKQLLLSCSLTGELGDEGYEVKIYKKATKIRSRVKSQLIAELSVVDPSGRETYRTQVVASVKPGQKEVKRYEGKNFELIFPDLSPEEKDQHIEDVEGLESAEIADLTAVDREGFVLERRLLCQGRGTK